MGALTYEPVHHFDLSNQAVDLDEIAVECATMLRTDYSDNLDDLFRLGGSFGGAISFS